MVPHSNPSNSLLIFSESDCNCSSLRIIYNGLVIERDIQSFPFVAKNGFNSHIKEKKQKQTCYMNIYRRHIEHKMAVLIA